MKIRLALALLAGAAALAGCSDSPYEETPPPADSGQVPASAGASTSAYFSYVNSLQPSDNTAPLGVDAVTPPTSETEQPRAL